MARYLLIAAWMTIHFSLALAGPEKLDPLLRLLAPPDSGKVTPPSSEVLSNALQFGASGEEVHVILRTRTPGAAWNLPGFSPSGVFQDFATGTVKLQELLPLSDHPEVVYLEAARPLSPMLDVSVSEVGAPSVWAGPPGTRGGGTLIGIVDSGIDPFHLDFRVDRDGDGQEEGSRILFLWDQTLPGDGSSYPYRFDYGRVYTQSELEAGIQAGYIDTTDTMGHGTHVAGIAAGDGSSSAAGYVGVAPEANLILVKTTFYTEAVIDGIAFVFERASELGLPCVVNLSLGGHAGPHDGTSLFEQAIDALVDGPGRAIVVAAGNEAQEKIHVGAEVYSRIAWHLVAEGPIVAVQLWHGPEAAFKVEVIAPTGERVVAPPGAMIDRGTSAGRVWVDNNYTGTPYPGNGYKEVYITLTEVSLGSTWTLSLEPVFGGGRVDGWVEDSTSGYFLEGDSHMSIAEPGNAHRVITVGAYVTKTSWDSLAGPQHDEGYTLGELADFSSHGPTRDGRLKPDLVAPGAWIASSLSSAAAEPSWLRLPDGEHFMLRGTSMAAPHVAGACALLFSLSPGLSWDELRDALTSGARADSFTEAVPNYRWGWGKLFLPTAVEETNPTPVQVPSLRLLENPVSREARFLYELPQGTGWAELRVYDLAGRLLWGEELSGRVGEAHWPLTTLRGAPLASGLYLAVVTSDRGTSPIVRVVVQR
ncbi:S8 family serine peptidase [Candidatus Bipolaricaulota bacterium]|nr:S8 family serine peptidase [Candidatus Bipolaricaulota bacterium]